MFYNMWNLPDCFRLPVKACRPQPQLRLLDRLFTVQGLVTNHKQGRVNLLSLPKNVPADSSLIIAQAGISSSKIFGNVLAVPLTNFKTLSRKKPRTVRCPGIFPSCAAGRPARNKKKPALAVCNHACELLQHAGRLDCFRRPVKGSAT